MERMRNRIDQEPEPKKGDKFILSSDNLIHVLGRTTIEESPSGIEHEIYHAICGVKTDGYTYEGDLATADFIPSLDVGISNGAERCEKCQSMEEISKKPLFINEEDIVMKMAQKLKSFYMSGGNYLTSIKLYVDPELQKTEMWVGYENSDRLRETGPEDTMPDLLESLINWPGVGSSDNFTAQLKRASDLSKELGTMVIIKCGKATGYIMNGKVDMGDINPNIFLGSYDYLVPDLQGVTPACRQAGLHTS